MFTARAKLKSASPYSQGRFHDTPALEREIPAKYEERTWKNRLHVTKDGHVFIPPMAFKNCLQEAAKYMGIQIEGKGKANYTKHFEAGVLVVEPLILDIDVEEVEHEWLFVPADGKPGGDKRVKKCFPLIHEWSGMVDFLIFDEIITEDIFRIHLEKAGQFIGVGRFRPRKRGYYGRFVVEEVEWINGQ